MDKVVGSLIQMLEEKDVIEDTIIVFASDNGGLGTNVTNDLEFGHLPSGPLREEKGSIYEGGHRISITIRWDNGMIPKGEKRPHMVGLNDLFATLTDFANITVPYGQASDSVSFAI
jgi:arylsulfatase A